MEPLSCLMTVTEPLQPDGVSCTSVRDAEMICQLEYRDTDDSLCAASVTASPAAMRPSSTMTPPQFQSHKKQSCSSRSEIHVQQQLLRTGDGEPA